MNSQSSDKTLAPENAIHLIYRSTLTAAIRFQPLDMCLWMCNGKSALFSVC